MEKKNTLLSEHHSGDMIGEQHRQLRYGENAYQTPAIWFKENSDDPLALHNFTIHAGNPSFVNITDVDRALHTMTHIAAAIEVNKLENWNSIVLGLKHGNLCGGSIGLDNRHESTVKKMLIGNPRAIFGGTVVCNFKITPEIAEILLRHGTKDGKRRPLDIVVGSDITEGAIEVLKRTNDRCLIMTNPALSSLSKESIDSQKIRRRVRGGWLEQPNYEFILDLHSASEVKKYGKMVGSFAEQYIDIDTVLAWAVCATSNSNTITLAKDRMIIANAVGQQDRVGAVELAIKIAKDSNHQCTYTVAVSDSFFPFPDAPNLLMGAGVSRILATSGSINDPAIIELFKDSETKELVHISDKIARGFFGH